MPPLECLNLVDHDSDATLSCVALRARQVISLDSVF